MRKFIVIVLCLIISVVPCSALTINSTYGETSPTSSQVTNLLQYAEQYNSIYNSNYIFVRDTQNSYYMAWGKDLKATQPNKVVGSGSWVRYYRPTTTSDWQYQYVEDDNISITTNYLAVSNTGMVAFNLERYDQINFWHNVRMVLIGIGALILMLFLHNRFHNKGYTI